MMMGDWLDIKFTTWYVVVAKLDPMVITGQFNRPEQASL